MVALKEELGSSVPIISAASANFHCCDSLVLIVAWSPLVATLNPLLSEFVDNVIVDVMLMSVFRLKVNTLA